MFFLFVGCTNNSIYRQSKHIENECWHKDSVVQFVVNIADTVNYFDIYINVRNTNEYPRQNLFLFVQTISPLGISLVDTVNILLADDYGLWTGKNISRIWEKNVLLFGNVKFAKSGDYIFKINQGMRFDLLNGISDVAMNIEHVK